MSRIDILVDGGFYFGRQQKSEVSVMLGLPDGLRSLISAPDEQLAALHFDIIHLHNAVESFVNMGLDMQIDSPLPIVALGLITNANLPAQLRHDNPELLKAFTRYGGTQNDLTIFSELAGAESLLELINSGEFTFPPNYIPETIAALSRRIDLLTQQIDVEFT